MLPAAVTKATRPRHTAIMYMAPGGMDITISIPVSGIQSVLIAIAIDLATSQSQFVSVSAAAAIIGDINQYAVAVR